jgi:DNA replication and repair protein RecF
MFLSRIRLDNFRNYKELSIDFPEKGMLLSGTNGSGKTNLLEAVFLLCTARSQRGSARNEIIGFSSDYCYAEGVFSNGHAGGQMPVSIGFNRDQKVSMTADGRPIASFSQWLGHGMAVSFGPEDIELVQGAPAARRNFLDIFISQVDPHYLASLISYKKNLAQRNRLLAQKISDAQLDVYEEAMAVRGAAVFLKRREICDVMAPLFAELHGDISGGGERATMEYRPSVRCGDDALESWKSAFLGALRTSRARDVAMGFSSIGPHRDDIDLYVNGNSARSFASLGQATTIALSLRMATVMLGERRFNDTMIFLFDDAISYLDSARSARVFPLLEHRGQLLVTAPTDRDGGVFSLPRFIVRDGTVAAL